MADKIAVVGAGLIGRAWAIAFARAGHEVALHDPDAGALAGSVRDIGNLLADMEASGLLPGQKATQVATRITPQAQLEAALVGASYVQENTPEKLEVKRGVFEKLDVSADAKTILASSSSSIPASQFTENLRGRARCVVAHPINPPHLVPAVELVPAPWTDPAVLARTKAIMESIGQAPIVMSRELDGFIVNRLQAALLMEAYRLVEDGFAAVEDVDIAIRKGLGLRWSFMGPFETMDLNAHGGVADYGTRYGTLLNAIGRQQPKPPSWSGESLKRIEAERIRRLPRAELAKRQRWRDRRLMALLRHIAEAERDIGA